MELARSHIPFMAYPTACRAQDIL